MRIQLHHSYFSPVRAGHERRLHCLAEQFLRRGIHVTVVAPENGVDDSLSYTSQGLHIAAHPSAFTSFPYSTLDPVMYSRRVERWFRQSLQTEPPDMVLCFSYYYVIAAKHVWPSAQVCFLPGGVMWDRFNDLTAHRSPAVRALLRPKRRLSVWAENRAVQVADKLYVESDWLTKRLTESYAVAEEKISVLPAPVDTNRFQPSPMHRNAIRDELGIGPNTKVILALGRLDARKNYTVLLRAVAQLSKKDWILLFVGSGPQEQELRNIGRGLGIEDKLLFAGRRADPERVYPSADLYCQPSLWESYSNALQEAVSCGLPCIISDSNVNRDLLDGVNVLLANPLDPIAWAQRIDLLLSDVHLARKLGANARSFAETRPSWSDLAD